VITFLELVGAAVVIFAAAALIEAGAIVAILALSALFCLADQPSGGDRDG